MAPIAPEPFMPEASTPVKVITVIDDVTLCESVAVTFTWLKGKVAKARQISAVPACVLVLWTSVQLNPAPVTPVTVVFAPDK
jgi:hypothetical protein